jgi:hypothetical protein
MRNRRNREIGGGGVNGRMKFLDLFAGVVGIRLGDGEDES